MDDQCTNGTSGRLATLLPRFSVNDLLRCTTLVGLGLGAILLTFSPMLNHERWGDLAGMLRGWLCLGGSAAIGAGALIPFKKPWLGAALGLTVLLVICLYLIRNL
jgi:hypothetical protein